MKMNRRALLAQKAAFAAVALMPGPSRSQAEKTPIMRAIPRTGEELPIIGIGGSATFAKLAKDGNTETLTAVLRKFVDNGGKVFDSAPMYGGGATSRVAGSIIQNLNN